jgi:hypothetical protein
VAELIIKSNCFVIDPAISRFLGSAAFGLALHYLYSST